MNLLELAIAPANLSLSRVILGLALSAAIGGLGFWRRSLTASGWLGAVLVGTATFGFGGWAWGLLIIGFFAASSALSKVGKRRKLAIAADKFSKDDQRDLWQALANGGLPALLALGYAAAPHPAWWAASLGAIATAAADTWATEIGVLSQRPPRLLTSGKLAEPGTSGAVSALGLGATAAGALAMGLIGWAACAAGLGNGLAAAGWMVPAALAGGVGGSLADSLLGATLQEQRWCPACAALTERAVHSCGTATEFRSGWRWLGNDLVNLLSIGAGAGLALGVWAALGG